MSRLRRPKASKRNRAGAADRCFGDADCAWALPDRLRGAASVLADRKTGKDKGE